MNSLDFENWRASVKHRQAARRSEAANEKGDPTSKLQPKRPAVPSPKPTGWRGAHWKEMDDA